MQTTTLDKTRWDSWLEAKGLSNGTIGQYAYYFGKFDFEKLSQSYLIDYINRYHNNVARAFLKNLIHYIKTNEFPKEIKLLVSELDIPKITGRKKVRIPQILSEEQVFRLSNAVNGERNKIMVLLTFFGGLRVSELCKIKPYDFMWENWLRNPEDIGRLRVIGKGNKQRPVLLPSKLMARIYTWIKNEVSNVQSKDVKLFRISSRRWEQILDRAGEVAIGRRIHPHLLRHCFQLLSSNILTIDGWKRGDEVKIGDLVFTFNIEKNRIEIQPIKKIYIYDCNNEEFYKIKNRYLDYSCTTEHINIFRIGIDTTQRGIAITKWKDWELISVPKLLEKRNKRLIHQKVSGTFNGKISIGKAKAGLLGWILTDGCINKKGNGISISQSLTANKKKCEYIEKLIQDAKISYSKNVREYCSNNHKTMSKFCEFRFLNGRNGKSKGTNNDWVWEWINKDRTPKYNLLTLEQEELQELYKCMMLGDGTNRKDGYSCCELTTQNKARIDFFRALCSLLGKRTILRYKKNNVDGFSKDKDKLYFRTYITNNDYVQIKEKHISKENYTGKVWCPETPNKTWIAKSNETIFITGNSCSTWLAENGFTLQEISEYLGHSSISTTQLYVHLSQEKIQDKFQKLTEK